jgi:hypothetical protein
MGLPAGVTVVTQEVLVKWMRLRLSQKPRRRTWGLFSGNRSNDPDFQMKLNEWKEAAANDRLLLSKPDYDWSFPKEKGGSSAGFLFAQLTDTVISSMFITVFVDHPEFERLRNPITWWRTAYTAKGIVMMCGLCLIFGYCYYTISREKYEQI